MLCRVTHTMDYRGRRGGRVPGVFDVARFPLPSCRAPEEKTREELVLTVFSPFVPPGGGRGTRRTCATLRLRGRVGRTIHTYRRRRDATLFALFFFPGRNTVRMEGAFSVFFFFFPKGESRRQKGTTTNNKSRAKDVCRNSVL